MLRRVMLAAGGGVAPAASPTFNLADKNANATLSESDKRMTRAAGANQFASARAITGHSATDAGGFYYEMEFMGGADDGIMIGVGNSSATLGDATFVGSDANGWGYYGNGNKYNGAGPIAYGATYGVGNIIGVLVKNGKIYFRKNGTWQNAADSDAETGAAFTGMTGTVYPMASGFYSGTSSVRFVTRTYSLPTGAAEWG